MAARDVLKSVVASAFLAFALSACSAEKTVELEPIIVSRPAPIPEGAVEYCWEEPIVEYEKSTPGLGAKGHWYHPSYTAVRQVRAGKWRPCTPR